MRKNAVKCDAAVLIRVESLVEKVTQKAAVLRDAFAIHALRRSDRTWIVLGIGCKISNGGKTRAGNNGIGNNVNVLVNLSRLKTAVEVNESIAGDELAVDRVRELPLGARYHRARAFAGIAHCKHVARVVGSGHWILG